MDTKPTEETTSSVAADDWQDIAQRLRLELAKRIPDIAAMTPEEMSKFTQTLTDARWFEVRSASHDDQVEKDIVDSRKRFD